MPITQERMREVLDAADVFRAQFNSWLSQFASIRSVLADEAASEEVREFARRMLTAIEDNVPAPDVLCRAVGVLTRERALVDERWGRNASAARRQRKWRERRREGASVAKVARRASAAPREPAGEFSAAQRVWMKEVLASAPAELPSRDEDIF